MFGPAAVAAVPVAPAVVVGVIAVSVANKTLDCAILAAATFATLLWVGVEAFAFVNGSVLAVQIAGAGIATVPIVPVTSAVVILCVAEKITHPGTLPALAAALLFAFNFCRVSTKAIGAEYIIFVTAAVTTIPSTNRVVI